MSAIAPPTDPYCVAYYQNYVPSPSPASVQFQHSLDVFGVAIGLLFIVACISALSGLRAGSIDEQQRQARHMVWYCLLAAVIALAVFSTYNYGYLHDLAFPPIPIPT